MYEKTVMKSTLFFLLQSFVLSVLFVSPTDAFQVKGSGLGGCTRLMRHTQRTQTPQVIGAPEPSIAVCFNVYTCSMTTSRRPPTVLFAGKQQKKKPSKIEPPPKVDGLSMFLAYATPWRNPNSIFVYLILIVYLLGTYSEAQSAAAGGGTL